MGTDQGLAKVPDKEIAAIRAKLMTYGVRNYPVQMELSISPIITSLRARGASWDELSGQQQDEAIQAGIQEAHDRQADAVRARLTIRRPGLQPHEINNSVAAVQNALMNRGLRWDGLGTQEQDALIDAGISEQERSQAAIQRRFADHRALELNPLACPACSQVDRVQRISSVVRAGTATETIKGKLTTSGVIMGQDGFSPTWGGGPIRLEGQSKTALAAMLTAPTPPARPGLFAGRRGRNRYRASLRRFALAYRAWEGLYYCARDDGVYWPGGWGFRKSATETISIQWTIGRLFPVTEYWTTLWALADAGLAIVDSSIWIGDAADR